MKRMTHEEVLDEINVLYERLQSLDDCEGKYVGCGYCSFNDGRYIEALEALIDYYETDIVKELEKIKAELENMWIKSAKDLRTGEVIYENLCEHSEVLEILNKHISELKGE